MAMQSSPPQRAWDPPSPATTKYSLDLAALEHDSRSDASTPLPGQDIDKILSEDIDGPSDFTQNMEMWMRGGSMRQASTVKERLGSVKETGDEHIRGAVPTMQPQEEGPEDAKTASNHTPTNSPAKGSAFRESATHDDDGEEVASSLWDKDGEDQTPRSNGVKALLQPTVEDYYSELNLVGAPSIQIRSPPNPSESPVRGPRPSAGRASSPTLSPDRTPAPSRQADRSDRIDASLERQIQDLSARCQQLEQLNATINKKLDEERRLREADSAAHTAKLTKAARREKDLVEMKAQSHSHKEDFRREFGELKERLRQRDAQQARYQQELDHLKKQHEAEMQTLREELDNDKGEHEQEILAMEIELELQRRGRADFEEVARSQREELDERRTEVEKMKMELQQGEELREQIKEQLRVSRMDYEKLRGTISPAQEVEKKAIEDLQRELKETKQSLREEKEAHDRLKSSVPANDVNEDLDSLRTRLNEATIERDELQDRLTAETEAKQTARDRVEELEGVNEIIDARISGAIKRREAYWQEQMAKKEDERRVMAKLILRLWGRVEVGPEDEEGRQAYKYLYPLKKGKGKQKEKKKETLGVRFAL